jgi:hypothetical protein
VSYTTEFEDDDTQSCQECGYFPMQWRRWEDFEGHEDIQYQCPKCRHGWWVEGCDS